MLRMIRALRDAGVLSMNARNSRYIMTHNQRRFYPLVDDKIRTKTVLREYGINAPDMLGTIRTQYEAGHLASRLQPLSEFVIKPAAGSRGDGIVVIGSRRDDRWVSPSGHMYSLEDLQFHVSGILNGMYSLGGHPDAALLEALVRTDSRMRAIAPEGVPDVRIVVYRGIPVMGMTRLPTRRSGGRANLHHGAIGAGIDMATGHTLQAVMNDRVVTKHPDTGADIAGFAVPDWPELVTLAARCFDPVPLGYLGVDIVLDAVHGPQVLELNARPGLSIQIANRAGLRHRLAVVDTLDSPEQRDARARATLAMELATSHWNRPLPA
jgi:alpha-L-glutamate ligase-like protein